MDNLPKYCFDFSYNDKKLQNFSEISDELSTLLKQQVLAVEPIDRFKDNTELNTWAEEGFELHRRKDEKKKCLFCQNEFPAGFLESLSKHFSKDYKKLQDDIASFCEALEKLKNSQIPKKF